MSESSSTNWDAWGLLANRYRLQRPRRMLALDGGGIRGLITLQVLARLEQKLRAHYHAGDNFRLCQFFDYIGGTSTGAIIAAALAIGMSTAEILRFYGEFGALAFSRRRWYDLWKSLYDSGALQRKLQEIYGDKTDLTPPTANVSDPDKKSLKCLLLVVTRNTTTDSAWPISSNPAAKFNDLARPDCNLRIPLWKIVRASTAAPLYFPPEVIQWDANDPSQAFVFVDGGTTPYNNPAFLLARMATEPAYCLGWPRGEENLLVVSVGTGTSPILGTTALDPETNLAKAALTTLQAVVSQAQFDQDINCRTIGRCTFGRILDSECGDLVPRDSDGRAIPLRQNLGRDFLYARYEVELTKAGLSELGIRGIDPKSVCALDSVDHMPELCQVGKALAERVDLAHFGHFTDLSLS